MNRSVSMLLTFVAGVGLGVVATYRIAEQKYRNIADEEIESVLERFSNRQPTNLNEDVASFHPDVKAADVRTVPQKTDIMDYRRTVKRINYDTISEVSSRPNNVTKEEVVADIKTEKVDDVSIYVITPDEFDTLDDFTSETLYYSSDNYVIDSDYQVMSDHDIARMIGHDPYGHFGEYDDDTVYVRNERLKCDYEILLSMKTCNEIRED